MEGTFGSFIKDLRTEKGLTLAQLASKLSMDPANLSKVENGIREFDIKRVSKLCKVFGLDKSKMEIEIMSERFAKSICDNKDCRSQKNN